MTSSSLNGKPDDYASRKSWTNRDWFTHVGAWENEQGQLCFGSSIAFCAMMEQLHRTHTAQLLTALQNAAEALKEDSAAYRRSVARDVEIAIAAATGAA